MKNEITADCSMCKAHFIVKMKDLKAYSKSLYPRTKIPMPKMSEKNMLIKSMFISGCPSCLPEGDWEWKDVPAVEWVKQ